METKTERQITERIQDERWYAKMAALEANWRAKIARAQSEYFPERPSLNGEWLGSEIKAAVSVLDE